MNVLILAVPSDWMQRWCSVGKTRAEAESWYRNALRGGQYQKPVYRVICTRKAA